jgi:hypothetical protein
MPRSLPTLAQSKAGGPPIENLPPASVAAAGAKGAQTELRRWRAEKRPAARRRRAVSQHCGHVSVDPRPERATRTPQRSAPRRIPTVATNSSVSLRSLPQDAPTQLRAPAARPTHLANPEHICTPETKPLTAAPPAARPFCTPSPTASPNSLRAPAAPPHDSRTPRRAHAPTRIVARPPRPLMLTSLYLTCPTRCSPRSVMCRFGYRCGLLVADRAAAQAPGPPAVPALAALFLPAALSLYPPFAPEGTWRERAFAACRLPAGRALRLPAVRASFCWHWERACGVSSTRRPRTCCYRCSCPARRPLQVSVWAGVFTPCFFDSTPAAALLLPLFVHSAAASPSIGLAASPRRASSTPRRPWSCCSRCSCTARRPLQVSV